MNGILSAFEKVCLKFRIGFAAIFQEIMPHLVEEYGVLDEVVCVFEMASVACFQLQPWAAEQICLCCVRCFVNANTFSTPQI